jgi:hypothetical protein
VSRQISYSKTMYVMSCCNCGIEFGVPDDWDSERREDHKSFYCPNGHPQSYQGKTEAELLRVKLDREKENSDWHRKRAEAAMEAKARAERQRDAYKGHTTRLKKRVAKGTCPSCSSSFPDLAAHMAEAHPEYAEAAETDG